MKPGVDMVIQQLPELPGADEIFEKYIPGRLKFLLSSPQTKHLSIRQIVKYSKGAIPTEILSRLDAELKERYGTSFITKAEREKISRYQTLASSVRAPYAQPVHREAFYPGQPITDTEGKRIHAHGGAILEENGVYYWYGENKEFTDGTGDIWTWGVKAYRSTDLYNWTDMGQIIEPVLDDPDSPLFPDMRIDRPHILKNDRTGKYVCWIHLAGKVSGFLIMQANAFLGPYEIVDPCYRPEGYDAGDFDLTKDENGDAYLYYDIQHSTVIGMKLTPDYLRVAGTVSRQYEGMFPPFCREGIAVFERNGKKYMLSSGMTGYVPNRSDVAVSDGWEESFVSLGDPYPEDDTHSSFNSQFTDVYKVPGKKDLYIAMSDRWVPDYPVDAKIADIMERAVAKNYAPDRYSVTPEEQEIFNNSPNLHTANTSAADYVWLPIDFSGEKPVIHWRDNWTLDEFA